MSQIPLFLEDIFGNKHYIEKEIGAGGQGIVFSTMDSNIAIKLVTNKNQLELSNEVRSIFNDKIEEVLALPLPSQLNLSKPEVLLKPPYCGYVMKLLDLKQLINMSKVFDVKNYDEQHQKFKLNKRLEVLIELARMLSKLHSEGFVYCDLSPNNVFFSNLDNFSKVWLIDCDNIRFSSQIDTSIFTPNYGAPEIVSGHSTNSVYSDIFSFAILAFRTLFLIRPFVDNIQASEDDWDQSQNETQKRAFQKQDYNYIGEATDLSSLNFQKEVLQKFSTKKLLELFNRTFCNTGITNPVSRPLMHEWYNELTKFYSALAKCSNPECNKIQRYNFKNCYACAINNPEYNIASNIMRIGVLPKKQFTQKLLESVSDDWDKTTQELRLTNKNDLKFSEITLYQHFRDIKLYPGKKVYNFELNQSSISETPSLVFEIMSSPEDSKLIIVNHGASKLHNENDTPINFKRIPLDKNFRVFDVDESLNPLKNVYTFFSLKIENETKL